MSPRSLAVIAGLAVALCPAAPLQAAEPDPAELRAEVPALEALHEVIAPLWHTAWPAKDVASLKAALPQLEARTAAVESAELPGILRDRRPAWQGAVAVLKQAVSSYAAAAGADDPAALLGATEAVHAAFEGLVRVVRPSLPELEAYHAALYPLVHYAAPEGRLGESRAAIEALAARCAPLASAPLPRRVAARAGEVRAGLAALCTATEALRAAAGGEAAALPAALDEVHARYQTVAKLLE